MCVLFVHLGYFYSWNVISDVLFVDISFLWIWALCGYRLSSLTEVCVVILEIVIYGNKSHSGKGPGSTCVSKLGFGEVNMGVHEGVRGTLPLHGGNLLGWPALGHQ